MVETRKLGFKVLIDAIAIRLANHANTSAYTVYGYVKSDATMPYITVVTPIGSRSEWSAQDLEGESNTYMVHVWSDYKGDKECADIMNNVSIALNSSALTIVGYTNIITKLDFSEIIPDETESAKTVHHGVMRFRFEMG